MQRANDVTRARRALGQWAAGGRHGLMEAILKVWRHIKTPTPPIIAYLVEEQSCYISSRSGRFEFWNDGVLDFYEGRRPNREQEEQQDE